MSAAVFHVKQDHPRSRGVYPRGNAFRISVMGSSPLARGLPGIRAHPDQAVGIIPARAGFTVGGYHVQGKGSGSSPLARGLHAWNARESEVRRIIPARAGFTRRLHAQVRGRRDHPRSRGVYMAPSPSSSLTQGSSPLARGLHSAGCGACSHRGIIPARAGFTAHRRFSCMSGRDHPRSRGVYADHDVGVVHDQGSSPLARGLLGPLGPADISYGIIPARAGFTPRKTERE